MTGAEPFIVGALKGFLASKAVEKAQESLASELTKSAWSSGAAQVKPGTLTDQLKQQIFNASGQYISSYADRHGILKVLGMMEPVWIEDIYTRVQFLDNDGIRQYLSLENLEQAYRETQQRRFQAEKCEKRDGVAVANQQQYLMVLGQPGAGKSTFLRRIGLEALKREESDYGHNCIPVFLELKRFNTGTVDIEQAIVREFTICNFPDPARSTTRLLEDGKLLILLDGLDEVPTQQMDHAITQIQDFCDRYSQNRFIASCRTAAYRSRFRQFRDVIMADFDDEQIRQFIINWFRSKDDQELGTAQKCWNLLQQPEYAATRELAQTPLLLTFLCLVFDDAQTFPKQRAILYKDALDVLLKRWAAEKRIQRDPIYQDLTLPLEEMMLAEIAYTGFVSNRFFFSEREVVDQIRTFLGSNLNAPKHLDGNEILNAIQIQQGIIVERARGILSFSHLTIQEYLTAQYIADNNLIEHLVSNYLCDQRWREVFILVAGLMRGGVDNLLVQMEAATQKLMDTDNLKNLLQWAEQVTESSMGDFKSTAKRSLALDFVSTLDRALHIASFILAFETNAAVVDKKDNLTRYVLTDPNFDSFSTTFWKATANASKLAITLDRSCNVSSSKTISETFGNILENSFNDENTELNIFVPILRSVLDFSTEVEESKICKDIDFMQLIAKLDELQLEASDICDSEVQDFLERIWEVWFDCLQIKQDLIDLSDKEILLLENYLYASNLIVQCREAAVYVSPKVWAGIEARMLTVRDDG